MREKQVFLNTDMMQLGARIQNGNGGRGWHSYAVTPHPADVTIETTIRSGQMTSALLKTITRTAVRIP